MATEHLIDIGRRKIAHVTSKDDIGAHDRATGAAGDLNVLTAIFLPSILLVMQLDVGSDDLVVIALDTGELVGNVLAEMVRNLNVAAPHDDLDQSLPSFHATSTI